MFIVTPYLSSNPAVFGIYSVCISVSIFLAYADLGFLAAGHKYAAEEYAKANLDAERKIVGFSGFILLIFVLLCAAIFGVFSAFPTILIPSLSVEEELIVSKLLFILAISTPVVVFQRIADMIFGIRIDAYIFQRIKIIGNIVKICSIFFFFTKGKYDIVGYYAFMQILNLIVALIALTIANRRYTYDFIKLIRVFRFDLEIFKKTKGLAFNSLFLTLSWIIYSECDNFVIGQLLGAQKIAMYAIGITLMSFLRSILGTIFSPFANRFNHYIGVGDNEGLKVSFSKLLRFSLPIVVFTISTIIILMRPLIFSWVGPEYEESIRIAQYLVACNIFAFLSYPSGILLSAQLRLKEMYIVGAIIPILYWCGITLTYSWLGLEAFALFKFISFLLSALIYLKITLNYLELSILEFIKKYLLRNVPSLIILFVILYFSRGLLPSTKNVLALLQVIGFGALTGSICMAIAYFSDPEVRGFLRKFYKNKKSVLKRN